jgi:hypothetical protein
MAASSQERLPTWTAFPILDSVWAAGAHLMGRVTYVERAASWPASVSEYARSMNEIPKGHASCSSQIGR